MARPPMRLLLVTPALPEPPVFGATQRTHLLHRALAELGEVDLLVVRRHARLTDAEEAILPALPRVLGVLDPEPAPPPLWIRALRRVHRGLGDRLAAEAAALRDYRPARASGMMQPLLRERYDAIIGRYLVPLCRAGAFSAGVPVVLDFDDADDIALRTSLTRRFGGSLPLPAALKLRRRRAIVRDRLRRCRHVFFLSESDRIHYPGIPGSTLPNIPFDPPAAPPPPSDRTLLLFVGLLTYAPNRAGIAHFLAAIWPAVRARVPGARLRLVGAVHDDDRAAWSQVPGVEVAGRVASLAPHYAEATACIAPLDEGGGTNIKVIEAAAHARACVVTRFSHHGFEQALRDGEAVLVAGDAAAFADHACRLLGDPALAARLGATARDVAAAQFSYTRFSATVHHALEAILRAPRA